MLSFASRCDACLDAVLTPAEEDQKATAAVAAAEKVYNEARERSKVTKTNCAKAFKVRTMWCASLLALIGTQDAKKTIISLESKAKAEAKRSLNEKKLRTCRVVPGCRSHRRAEDKMRTKHPAPILDKAVTFSEVRSEPHVPHDT